MRTAVFLALLFFSAARLEAQSDSLLTALLLGSGDSKLLVEPEIPLQKPPIRAIRLAASTGGLMFGMLLGGYSGWQLHVEAEDSDKPQVDAIVIGGTIGGAIGAGLGAAFLDLSSVCTFDKRFVRSLVGASIGAGALFVAGGGLERGGKSVFYVPIGAIAGSLGTMGRCWRSRY